MASERLIDEKSAQHIKQQFEGRMQRVVDVRLYGGQENGDALDFTRRFLGELAELDDRVHVSEQPLDDEARAAGLSSPSLVIGRDLGYDIQFLGAPSGIEAGTLVETLAMVSGDEKRLKDANVELLGSLDQDVTLHAFVTPTCPHCPGSVLLNHRIAMAAPDRVRSVAVSAVENMDLARRFNVSSVPQQVINLDAESSTVGVQAEDDFVQQVLGYGSSAHAARAAERQEAAAAELPEAPDTPVELTDASFDAAVAKYPFLVVDFWASWCGPCRMMAPVLDEAAKDEAGRIVFAKLNTENNQATPARFQVRSIPTLLVFKNGELADTLMGAMPKEELLSRLAKHREGASHAG